ncbi:MAG: FAD-dependent monooxygenase, partial [Nitratireductor sp.]
IVCTVEHELPHEGVAQEYFLPGGPFAILPMVGNRSSLVWTEKTADAKAILSLNDEDFTEEMRERFGDYLGDCAPVGPRWSYPLTLQLSREYVRPRLALVADAAHGVHPIAGQGLNLGLRDVAALAEVLVDAARLGLDIGQIDVLKRYEQWRRFDNTALSFMMDGLNRLFSNDIAPVRLARDLGLGAVNQIGPLRRLFMRHAGGAVGDLPRLLKGEAV